MAAPLDAERARLRALGLTEAEVSQVLINQASGLGSPQPAGVVPVQGNMTGVLGNASAVLSHARGALPAIKAELGNLSDSTAPAKSRGISTLKLAGVALIVTVLGYAIYQEWQIHIVNAPITAAAQAQKANAEAAVAPDVAEGERTKALAASLSPNQLLGIDTDDVIHNRKDCLQTVDHELTIRGCTNMLRSGVTDRLVPREWSYYSRGDAYRLTGRYTAAINDLNEAIKLNSTKADFYYVRALAHMRANEIDQTVADLGRAIELSPNEARFYHTRGQVYSMFLYDKVKAKVDSDQEKRLSSK